MTTLEITQRVDAKGLSCPMPIVRTAQAMKALGSGQLLEVLATDPGSTKDFEAWSKSTGNPLVESGVEGGVRQCQVNPRLRARVGARTAPAMCSQLAWFGHPNRTCPGSR